MKHQLGVRDGFKPRKTSDKPRKPRAPLKYQHIDDPAGRTFLLVNSMVAARIVGGWDVMKTLLITRKFAKARLTAKRLHDEVVAHLPDYPGHYEKLAGRKFSPNVCYHRAHKKELYTNSKTGKGAGEGACSRESIFRSPVLRARFENVERRLGEGSVAIPLQDMVELGK